MKDLTQATIKSLYEELITELLRGAEIPINGELTRSLIPLKCERDSPAIDWPRSWRLARLKGLGPDTSSFLLLTLWKVLPTRARLRRILPQGYDNDF